jgi:hypothetical protein
VNSLPPIFDRPGRAAVQIHAQRCARHPEREAAARCPACGGFFCRECVVEHDGRLLCAACLAKQEDAGGPRRGRRQAVRRQLALAAAVFAAGLVFYSLGSLLLSVPPDFHEGTVWGLKGGDSP